MMSFRFYNGNCAGVHLSHKRHHVMFAQREDFNVLYNYQLVMIFMEDGTVDKISHVLFIAFGEE